MGLYTLAGFKSWSAWLSVVMALFISMYISEMILGSMISLTGNWDSLDLFLGDANIRAMQQIFGAAISFILSQLVKKLDLKINIYALSRAELGYILLFLALFGFLVTAVFDFSNQLDQDFTTIIVTASALLSGLISVHLVFYIATQKSTIYEIQSRERQQELIFDEQKQNYERMKKRNEYISIFKHDTRADLLYLNDLLHNDKFENAIAYLAKMRGELDVIEQVVGQDTGSQVVNASWYALTNTKRFTEVEAKWLGRLPVDISMDERDLVSLFSNLLNNAFEAANKASDKYVAVKVDEKKKGLFIVVKNSYHGEIVEKLDGDFMTTKDDKENHGFGVRIIKNVVEKYGGKVKFSYSDGEFVSTVIFDVDICKAISTES